MTFPQHWQNLKDKNAGLGCEETRMTLKVVSLKNLLEQAFEAGKESSPAGLFEQIFGTQRSN